MARLESHTLAVTGPVRCYNGCYDSATQRVFDMQDRVMKQIKTKEPDAHVTYHPVEEYHHVHAWGRPLSGYHSTRGAALADAHNRLFPEGF